MAMPLETVLADGTRVRFRHIRPDDKGLLRDGFARLSPQSRYHRFFRNITHLTDRQVRYLTEIDFENHFAWVAVLPEADGEVGVGVGRWIRDPSDPTIAEGAVTVVDDYQGRGIGTALLGLLARSAREGGISSFRVWVMGDNRPMLDLLQRLGAVPRRWESGVLEILVPLPRDQEAFEGSSAPRIFKEVARGTLLAEGEVEGGTHLALARGPFAAPRRTRQSAPDRI